MDRRDAASLDRYITGNYGEDQMRDESKSGRKVGCETTDGLLNVHPVEETCEVCAPADVEGEVPKISETQHSDIWPCEHCAALDPNYLKKTTPQHKHSFAPRENGDRVCDCGAEQCRHADVDGDTLIQCEKVATKTGTCRKHNKISYTLAESKRGFWTAERITGILVDSDKTTTLESGKVVLNSLIIYRFLQRMFERQTSDEQQSFNTSHDNGIGFAGCDARLLSDIATGSKKFNDDYKAKYNRVNPNGLTVRQAKYVASRLKKYVRTQLVEIANEATSDTTQMPDAITTESLKATLNRMPSNSSGAQVGIGSPMVDSIVEDKTANLKLSNPAKYYDPFEEGERLSEEAALQFWMKRFRGQ
jgi:hypothetical protein